MFITIDHYFSECDGLWNFIKTEQSTTIYGLHFLHHRKLDNEL